MLKYVIWLSLACATLLGAGTALPSERQPRSIWPFSSSKSESDPLLSEENAKLLEAAGIDNFNFSSHPVWKIHKYEGIDLKPVVFKKEVVKSKPVDVNAESQAESHVAFDETSTLSSEATTDVADVDNSTTEKPLNLSFFDDLGGMAWLLPNPDPEEVANLKNAEQEEEENPGFFKKLWSKIWGSSKTETVTSEEPPTEASTETETVTLSEPADADLGFWASLSSWYKNRKAEEEPVEVEDETDNKDNDLTTVFLPKTQGSYVAVVIPTEQIQNELVHQQQQQQQLIPQQQQQQPIFQQQQQQQSQNTLLPTQSQPIETFREPEDQKPDHLDTPTSNSEIFDPSLNQFTEAETKAAEAAAERVTSIQQQIQTKPVASWNEASQSGSKKKDYSRSQAWVQSWSPHASYSYHIEGPGGNHLAERPAVTETVQPASQDVYQRKIDEVVEEGNVTELPEEPVQVQESNNVADVLAEPVTTTSTTTTTTTSTTSTTEASTTVEALSKIDHLAETVKTLSKNFTKDNIEKARNILSTFSLPPALAKKLQITEKDVEAILNDDESAARTAKKLRALQKEYERKKEQLSYAYPSIRKHIIDN